MIRLNIWSNRKVESSKEPTEAKKRKMESVGKVLMADQWGFAQLEDDGD